MGPHPISGHTAPQAPTTKQRRRRGSWRRGRAPGGRCPSLGALAIPRCRGRRGLRAIRLTRLKAKSKALLGGVFDGLRIDALFSFMASGNHSINQSPTYSCFLLSFFMFFLFLVLLQKLTVAERLIMGFQDMLIGCVTDHFDCNQEEFLRLYRIARH